MQPRLLAHLAGEIVRTVKVPVSIDFEAGYSDQLAGVVENLKPIVAAGISGINIEDGTEFHIGVMLVTKISVSLSIGKATGNLEYSAPERFE
jgi:2-methylisocitrate lyase-like PEP mutase family enzyme